MTDSKSKSKFKHALAYIVMVVLAAATTIAICIFGDAQFPQTTSARVDATQGNAAELLFHFLLALIVIVGAAKTFGWIFSHFNQPAVMGEVVAGIALGPSLLGLFSPELLSYLLPINLAPVLGMLSQLGVVLFMFLVGVELDTRLLKKKGQASLAISHASIIAPLLFGCLLALWLYLNFAPQNIPFTVFAVFMGVALSITAFPVLARILSDLRIAHSPMAALTLTCAAVDDITAWCLLALAIGLVQAKLLAVVGTLLWSVVFFAAVLRFAPALIQKIDQQMKLPDSEQLATTLMIAMVLFAALCTEGIGIHALFGPFLLGAMIPKESALAQKVHQKLEPLTVSLLLPIFFAFTGLRTQIGLVSTMSDLAWCALIVLVASIAKIGGASIAARLNGIEWRDALGVGVLMNTRGLMELIVLNIGLELKILTPTLFTMMVIMAVATTMMSGPLFLFVTKKRPWRVALVDGAGAT